MICCTHESPVGLLTLHSNGAALVGLEFEAQRHPLPARPRGEDKVLALARRELTAFTVATAPQGTAFQRQVWSALSNIPYGATRTYGEQAAAIGAPKAVRAVGLANGRNPISIIVPCHRVLGADGSLTGFGGGMERKQALLDLERGQARLR
jgi:methylated-DNA-[protein]-cysteine S-methyltransferase